MHSLCIEPCGTPLKFSSISMAHACWHVSELLIKTDQYIYCIHMWYRKSAGIDYQQTSI